MSSENDKRYSNDIAQLLRCEAHLGSSISSAMMKHYVYKKDVKEGFNIINVLKTHEKIMIAARIIVTAKCPKDVMVVSQRPWASRGIFKYAQYTGAAHQVSRWTAGTLTNQVTKQFQEPSILIVADPRVDAQAIKESHYANIPVIALCNTDSPLTNVDVAIPCNIKSKECLGLIFWMLAREVLYLRNELDRDTEWEVIPDLFFFKDSADMQKVDNGEEEIDEAQTYDNGDAGNDAAHMDASAIIEADVNNQW